MIVKSALKLARKKKKNRSGQVSPLLLVCRNLEKVMLLPNKAKVETTKS